MCLIPEVPFVLEGQKGLFAYLEKVLEHRGHAVLCVAEGAGQVLPISFLSSGQTTLLALLSIPNLCQTSDLLMFD